MGCTAQLTRPQPVAYVDSNYGIMRINDGIDLHVGTKLYAEPMRNQVNAEMLTALENLEPYFDAIVCYASTMEQYEPNKYVAKARAAIAKARGRQ